MKLDIYFSCPHCGERMQVTGESDEGEASWDLDIKVVEGPQAEEFEREVEGGEEAEEEFEEAEEPEGEVGKLEEEGESEEERLTH